jgi:hypothetical protein
MVSWGEVVMSCEHRQRGSWLTPPSVFFCALFLVIVASHPASAQFVCTTTSTDITCINSGTAAGIANNAGGLNQNATTTNSGSNTGGIVTQTTAGGNATATNSGSNTGGIFVQTTAGGNATATNSGSNTSGIVVQAITGNATATNSGSNTNGFVVQTTAGNATATNSGSNTNGFVVQTTAGNATATNSGSNTGGVVVQTTVGNATLNLLAGSMIIGSITLNGTKDTVNFLSGNHNLTIGTNVGLTGTGAIPFAVLGNQAAAVDPTPFAMTDRLLMDFSRSVSSAIPMIDGRPAPTSGAMAFAGVDDGANKRIADVFANIPGLSAYASDSAVFKSPTVAYRDGTVVWASGFAGQRVQQADDPLLHTLNQFYGGMIGADWQARTDLRLGGFIGGGRTRSNIDLNTGDTTSDLIFGGVFARYFWGNSYLQAVVQGGHSRTDTSRNINNNLLPGGLETAKASYDGWYVSPEVTYGLHYGLGSLAGASYTLTPSLQLRYLYASFDGYTESGTTAPLTVGTRTLGDFEERGQLKLTRTQVFAPTEALMTSVYGGVLGVQRVGSSTVDAILLGQAIPFATPGKDDVWGGFGGAGLEWRTGRVTLFASGEYLALSDSSTIVSGKGGIRVSF